MIFNKFIRKIKNKICKYCHVQKRYLQERTKTMTNLFNQFKWNKEYIVSHKLDESYLEDADTVKMDEKEVFVAHPAYKDYYVSQYGRAISLKRDQPKLLGANIGGQSDRQYLYYKFDGNTISVNRAVADVFCPNFWKDGTEHRLEAHHCNKQKMHNTWTNLVLLPATLHKALDKIKKLVLLKDGIIEYTNPLDLVYDTGLTLEDIILADKSKKKPLKSDGKYTVFNVKGNLIGYQYYPKKKEK